MLEHERRLTPREAGRRLGVTDRTVKRWIEQGKLRGYRPGRAYQVPESAVDELLEKSEIRPKEKVPLSLEWALTAPRGELEEALSEASLSELGSLAHKVNRYVGELDRSDARYPDLWWRTVVVTGAWGVRAGPFKDPEAETPRSGGERPLAPEQVFGEESQAG